MGKQMSVDHQGLPHPASLLFYRIPVKEDLLCSVSYKHSSMEIFLYEAVLISELPLGATFTETQQGVLDGFKLPQTSPLLEASPGKPELLALSIVSEKGFFIFSTNFANKYSLTVPFRMLIAFIPGFRTQCPREHWGNYSNYNFYLCFLHLLVSSRGVI